MSTYFDCLLKSRVHQVRTSTLLPPAGDFFQEDVPPAELYILARIIHDWPEEKCLTLLKKLWSSCSPGQDQVFIPLSNNQL